jgi:hypothetical protein
VHPKDAHLPRATRTPATGHPAPLSLPLPQQVPPSSARESFSLILTAVEPLPHHDAASPPPPRRRRPASPPPPPAQLPGPSLPACPPGQARIILSACFDVWGSWGRGALSMDACHVQTALRCAPAPAVRLREGLVDFSYGWGAAGTNATLWR